MLKKTSLILLLAIATHFFVHSDLYCKDSTSPEKQQDVSEETTTIDSEEAASKESDIEQAIPKDVDDILEIPSDVNDVLTIPEDVDDILDNLGIEIDIEFEKPPAAPEITKPIGITTWDKIKYFWQIPMSLKWELLTENVKEHKIGYTVGTFATAAGVFSIIYWFRKKKKKQKEENGQ